MWYVRIRRTLKVLKRKGLSQEEQSAGQFGKFLSHLSQNMRLTVRLQEVTAYLWGGDSDPRMLVNKTELPPVKIYLKNPALEFSNSDGRTHAAALAKEAHITVSYRRETDPEAKEAPPRASVIPTMTGPHVRRVARSQERATVGPASKEAASKAKAGAEESVRTKRVKEGADVNTGQKVSSVVAFQCGAGYMKECVFKFSYDNRPGEDGNLVRLPCERE